jgi:phage-related protein
MGDWLSDLEQALQQVGQNMQNWFSNVWDALVSEAKAIISGYTAIATSIVNGLETVGNWIHDGLTNLGSYIKDAYDYLRNGLSYVGNKLYEAYNALGNWIHGALDTLGNWFKQAYDALSGGIKWVGDKLHEAFDTFGNWFHKAWDTFGSWLKEAHDVLGNLLKDGFNYIRSGLDTIGQVIGGGINSLGNYLHTAWNNFSSYLKSAWDWFSQQVYNFGQWLWNGLQWLGGWFETGLTYVGQTLHNFGQWLWNGISWLGSHLWSSICWIGHQLYNFGQWLWNGVKWIGEMIWNALTGFSKWINDTFANVYSGVCDWWGSVINTWNSWWQNLILGIRNKIKSIIMGDVTVTLAYKGWQNLSKLSRFDLKDLGKSIGIMLVSPIIGALASEIVDAVIPTPHTETIQFIPQHNLLQITIPDLTLTKPDIPSAPDKGSIPTIDFSFDKPSMPSRLTAQVESNTPNLGQPNEPMHEEISYTGGAKTIVVDTTPRRLGELGTIIKSVTVKAPISNTSKIWLTISEDEPTMTQDEVFQLNAGEAIDIAIDDLGKVWVRAEEGTQLVSFIFIKVKKEQT